jgi:hypothetical protein
MDNRTVDSLVRETLMEEGLSIHFYAKLLLPALSELQRLAIRHKMSIKQQTLTINSYQRVAIPTDAIYVFDISIKSGERLVPAVRDNSISKQYNYNDAGEKISFPTANNPAFPLVVENDSYFYDRNNYGYGGWFGLNAPMDKTFTIDFENSEIVFSNSFDGDEIVITYTADPASTTSANLVRHEFCDVVKAAAKLKYREASGIHNNYEIEQARNEYINYKMVMKALNKPVSKADLIYRIRRGIHAGTKN